MMGGGNHVYAANITIRCCKKEFVRKNRGLEREKTRLGKVEER